MINSTKYNFYTHKKYAYLSFFGWRIGAKASSILERSEFNLTTSGSGSWSSFRLTYDP